MTVEQLVGKTITAKVKLHRYRYPENQVHVSGTYAIAVLELVELIEGEMTPECFNKKGYFILSGNMPKLDREVIYTLHAKLIFHKTYGYQYECENIVLGYDMSKKEDQEKFFSFFLTDRQINALFSMYSNPLEILDQKNVGALTKIKGIGPVTANRMCLKYAQNIDNGRAYVELKTYGLTKAAIDRLINHFGSADVVVDIIKENPYALIPLVRGYGWKKADMLALSQGMARDSYERCMAYARYRLEDFAEREGNSCMSLGELVDSVCVECAPLTPEEVVNWLKTDMTGETDFERSYTRYLTGDKSVIFPTFFYSKTRKKIGLYTYRLTERSILDNIKRLKTAERSFRYNKKICENIIKEVEAEQGFEYTHEQRSAIWNILDNNVCVLTGSSGTGKSSTLKPLIKIFKYYNLKVEQCALSGRAASLLTEYTKLEGKTIHRLLRYLAEEERFAYNKDNPLSADVILLDETSMVGEELFLSLISAIRTGAKLVMLGDIKQLPPLSVGNLLSDTIRSGYIPTSTLTIIQRQAKESGIIAQSIHVCEGKSIVKNGFIGEEIRGNLKDFKIVCNSESIIVHAKVIEEYRKLCFNCHISPDDIQIVVPQRVRGMNSCRQLNAEIQQLVNSKESKQAVTIDLRERDQFYSVTYKPGDRVMIIHNNYHAHTTDGKETAVFNGNMGHIISLSQDAMIINLEDQGNIIIPRDDWGTVQHSWACTCHKCQGSQAPYVIVVLDKGAYTLLTREWLYTALTRAKKYCILVGQPEAINLACRTSNIKVKQTWLKDDLYEAFLAEHVE